MPARVFLSTALLLVPIGSGARTALAADAPAAPSSVQATTSADKVTVRWTTAGAAASVSGFLVRCTPTGSTPALTARTGATARAVTLTGLASGTAYRCTVAATGPAGSSAATPGPFVAHVVLGTGGAGVTVALPVTAVQRLAATANPSARSPFFSPLLTVFRPDGGQAGTSERSSRSAAFVDATVMATSGTARIEVSGAGGIELTAYTFQDRSVAVQVDDPATPLAFRSPGQKATLTFSGTAGQFVALSFGTSDIAGLPYRLTEYGDVALITSNSTGVRGGLSGRITLPHTGRYALTLDPDDEDTGALTVRVVRVEPDNVGRLTVDAPAQTINLSADQRARRSFSASAGQQLAVDGTSDGTLGDVAWRVVAPDGSEVGSGLLGYGPTDFTRLPTVTETGTYLLSLTPGRPGGGALDIRIITVPAPSTGTVVVDAAAARVGFRPGQDAVRTFSGAVGTRLRLDARTVATLGDVEFQVIDPDGGSVTAGTVYKEGIYVEIGPLPVGGTYRIRLNPSGGSYGDLTLQLRSIQPDTTGALVLGQSSSISFGPGQNGSRTVPCTAGGRLKVTGTPAATLVAVDYELVEPSGRVALYSSFTGGATTVDLSPSITTSGTCTLRLDPVQDGAGNLTVTVTRYNA